MSYLPMAAVLSVLAFPCIAETLAERFSAMDLNKDGFLSEQEFTRGMNAQNAPEKKAVDFASGNGASGRLSFQERERLVDEAVSSAKKILPIKVDQATTWTDVYGKGDEIHYIYRVEMDVGAMPAEQVGMLKPVLEAEICPKVKPGMCGVANDTLLKNGISLKTHYNDKNGKPLAECRFTEKDCL